jgi:hypothetical protein
MMPGAAPGINVVSADRQRAKGRAAASAAVRLLRIRNAEKAAHCGAQV